VPDVDAYAVSRLLLKAHASDIMGLHHLELNGGIPSRIAALARLYTERA
jgi:hypothetical protein